VPVVLRVLTLPELAGRTGPGVPARSAPSGASGIEVRDVEAKGSTQGRARLPRSVRAPPDFCCIMYRQDFWEQPYRLLPTWCSRGRCAHDSASFSSGGTDLLLQVRALPSTSSIAKLELQAYVEL